MQRYSAGFLAAAIMGSCVALGIANRCNAELLLSYDFNDNSVADLVVDLSGKGNVAEVYDAEYTEDGGGRTGLADDRAMDFLGDQDFAYLEVPNAEEGAFNSMTDNDAATISLWAYGGEFQPQNNFAFWFADGDSDPRQLSAHIPWSNGQIYFDVAGCCESWQRIAGPLDPDAYQDRWTHYVFVKDGETTSIYVDGEWFLDSGANAIDPLDLITTVRFGSGQAPGQWSYNGLMDDIAVWDEALSEADIAMLFDGTVIGPEQPGDFNEDGVLDIVDIDLLTTEVSAGTHGSIFDLNSDQTVDVVDLNIWVRELQNTWVGDADLDGQFNSGDLVQVLASGTYEIDVDAVWSTGDFDGSGRADSSDLVAALADGGYEQGPHAATLSVPEPNSTALLLLGTLVCLRRRRLPRGNSAPAQLATLDT